MDLTGAGALVTGGASGLGRATALRLAAGGARVTVVDVDGAAAAVAAEAGGGAHWARADVTDPDAVAAAVAAAGEAGPLRVVVNAAGIGEVGRTVDRHGVPADLDRFRRVVEVNLVGTFNVVRLAAAAMAASEPTADGERGVIVNTTSVAAFEGQVGQAAYSASKGGVAALTLPLARDLAVVGVRVCAIAPGVFDTPILDMLPPAAKEALGSAVPFPSRLGRPEDFAALVAQVVANPYLNGETIRLDGALRLPPR